MLLINISLHPFFFNKISPSLIMSVHDAKKISVDALNLNDITYTVFIYSFWILISGFVTLVSVSKIIIQCYVYIYVFVSHSKYLNFVQGLEHGLLDFQSFWHSQYEKFFFLSQEVNKKYEIWNIYGISISYICEKVYLYLVKKNIRF